MNDVQDPYQPYVDEGDDPGYVDGADEAGGTSPVSLSMPDEAPRIELTQKLAKQIAQEIDRERKFIEQSGNLIVKVSTNISGSVLFQTFDVGASVQPMMIAHEKMERGDTVIVCHAGTVSIGLHAGIIAGGSDTVLIPTGSSRTVRTRQALWAVASVVSTIDVQEEFN